MHKARLSPQHRRQLKDRHVSMVPSKRQAPEDCPKFVRRESINLNDLSSQVSLFKMYFICLIFWGIIYSFSYLFIFNIVASPVFVLIINKIVANSARVKFWTLKFYSIFPFDIKKTKPKTALLKPIEANLFGMYIVFVLQWFHCICDVCLCFFEIYIHLFFGY